MRALLALVPLIAIACDDSGVITESRAPTRVVVERTIQICERNPEVVMDVQPFTTWQAWSCSSEGQCTDAGGAWDLTTGTLLARCGAGDDRLIVITHTPEVGAP